MPKKKQRRRKSRPAPARHRASVGGGRPPSQGGEPDLLTDVRRALDGDGPYELLAMASGLLTVVDPRTDDPFARVHGDAPPGLSLPELAASFIDVACRETTALLAVLAEMADDELVVQRIRRELRHRDDSLPAWLAALAPVRVVEAVVMSHVLGDGDNVVLGARTAGGEPLTVVVYIDHNLGTVAKDGFVVDEPMARTLEAFRAAADADPDVRFTELDLADARTRITDAIATGAMTHPPFETDTWPAARPLVEWITAQLPEGGHGYVRPEWGDDARRALSEDFFVSAFGRGFGRQERELFESLLWFGCDYGPGDPLRWSSVAVEILLTDWLPRKVVADVAFLARAPQLLRSFIRYAHGTRGIRPALTEETLAAVDRWEPAYQQTIRAPRPQGPAALLAAMGLPHGDAGSPTPPWMLGATASHDERMREMLRDIAGDPPLDGLDTRPLPDEGLDLTAVPPDVHDRVAAVGDLVDACCDDLLDVEHRTACRRLLHDVASANPDIFRRRGRADTAAAAIVWIVVKANHGFSQAEGGLTAKSVGEWFGVRSNPGQRARTLLQAIGAPAPRSADLRLGTPRYLVGHRRRWVAEMYERYGDSAEPLGPAG